MVPAVQTHPSRGALRVVPPSVLDERIKANDARRAEEAKPVIEEATGLAGFMRTQFSIMQNHRNSGSGWSDRLTAAQRVFKGEYDATKLNEIKKFGGSEVYARIIAMKCRGASALLRDVYLAPERSWAIEPPADPDVPPEIIEAIRQLVNVELQTVQQAGQPPPDAGAIRDRMIQLMEAARQGAKKQAKKRAETAQDKIEEILDEGGFYKALAEFIVDLPLFPFACIKGPTVRIVPSVTWVGGVPNVENRPKLFWNRISPFDLFWTPGVSDIEDASVIERVRYTRGDLNDLLDLPGYDTAAIRDILDNYGRGGLVDHLDGTDSERAISENRENPHINQSGIITGLEFHGNVQGKLLLDHEGTQFTEEDIPDTLRDYMVQAWLIGRHVIKVQLSPSPRKRHPYFLTSFEKVPGTPVGNGLPDILSDIQDVCNATLRSLVNNLSIASGPQVVVNDDRLAPGEDGEAMFPWKRWHVSADPMGNTAQVPISFFQPNSNAVELLGVFQKFSEMADDLSAIPRFLAGQGAGGAGRTAAGLSMLMSNASKILQTVAANIDRDVMDPGLSNLYDMLMLTDVTGLLQGDEAVKVMGVNVAVQRETERSRQLEFLSITANPIDVQIMGTKGRAAVLRSVSHTIGLDGQEIIPDEDKLAQIEMQNQAMQAEQAAEAQGTKQGKTSTADVGPRVKVAGGVG